MGKTSNPKSDNDAVMGLDVGAVRIGVAMANRVARIASPREHLIVTDTVYDDIAKLIKDNDVVALVVGLPRGLEGQQTNQTLTILRFVESLAEHITIPINMQDEALTSSKAEDELDARGKPYSKGDIDSLAACYILSDFLDEGKEW